MNEELIDLYFTYYKKSFYDVAKEYYLSIRSWHRDSSVESFNIIFTGLSLYYHINNKQIKKSITDWDKDYCFDAIYIPTESSNNNIWIFDFKWNWTLKYDDIKKFINYIEKYILDWKDLPRVWNKELKERLNELHDFLGKYPDKKIDIIIYREWVINDNLKQLEENKLLYLKWKYDKINDIKIISKKEIKDLVLNKLWYEWNIYSKNYSDFNLKVNKENFIQHDDLIIWTVSLFSLLTFILNINKNIDKYDIFKLNVRKKIDGSKNIRNNIINTVLLYPDNFIKYHNWINITTENFIVDNSVLNLKQPQIVNWCQTISWLYDYFEKTLIEYYNIIQTKSTECWNKEEIIEIITNIEKLKKANILLKISKLPSLSKEHNKICEYANKQNEVEEKELVSNNIEQLIISNYLWIKWVNYHRKEWQEFDRSKYTISIDLLYKFMYWYVLLDPSKWKWNKNIIFEDRTIYKKLFPEIFSLDDILKISNFYKSVNEYKKRNNINQYYIDYLVFWLFLLYKENWNENIKPSRIKSLLDKVLESKSWKKVTDFEKFDYMRYLQRMTWIINRDFIKILEQTYSFTLDSSKFSEFIDWFKKKRIQEREKYLNDKIIYKWFNLELLNDYKLEKDRSNKKLKATKFIIKDIIKNNTDILKEDLVQILKIFYKNYWDSKYLNSSKFLDSIDRWLSDKDLFYIKWNNIDLTFKD